MLLNFKKTSSIILLLLCSTSSYAGVLGLELDIDKHRNLWSLDALMPIYQGKGDALLISSAAKTDNFSSVEGDLGLAYRISNTRDGIFGLNYFLYSKMIANKNYKQHSIGAEYLSPWLDFRVNAYIPISKGPSFASEHIINDIRQEDVVTLYKEHPGVLGGYDLSLGIDFGALYLSATHYAFGRKENDKISGIKSKIEMPIDISDPLALKIGMEAVSENTYKHLKFNLFIGGKFVFGEVKDNLNRIMLNAPVIRGKNIKVKGYGAEKLQEEGIVVSQEQITERHLNIEHFTTGKMEQILIEEIKIVENYAELAKYLEEIATGKGNKLALVKNDFTDNESLDIKNENIENLFIAGSGKITATLRNGEKADYIFNPERSYTKGNPILLNIYQLLGEKTTFHELQIIPRGEWVGWSKGVDISNTIIHNKKNRNLFYFNNEPSLRLNNVIIRDDYSIVPDNYFYIFDPHYTVHLRNVSITSKRPVKKWHIENIEKLTPNYHTGITIFGRKDVSANLQYYKYHFHGNNIINYINPNADYIPTVDDGNGALLGHMYVFAPGVAIKADADSTISFGYANMPDAPLKTKIFTVKEEDQVTAKNGVIIPHAKNGWLDVADPYTIEALVNKDRCC